MELIPPPIRDVEVAFWIAFGELSTTRQTGFGPGPIPYDAIRDYETGIDSELFAIVIRSMDRAYLAHKKEAGKQFTRDMLKG